MKKIILLLVLIVSCLNLAACDPGNFRFDFQNLEDGLDSIDLIRYDNSNQKKFISWVPDHSSKLAKMNFENVTTLETLNSDRYSDLIMQLSDINFLYKYFVFDSPSDICIRLTYANGDFYIIWSSYVGIYNSSGEPLDFIGCFSAFQYYLDLVNNFFVTQVN